MNDNIFDEISMAKNIINNGFKNKKANKYELILIAKYYIWFLEHDKQTAKIELIDFCNSNDDNFNEIISSELINSALKISLRNNFRKIESIQITNNELKSIKSIKNFDYQKILFLLLVFSKALKFTFTNINNTQIERRFGYYIGNGLLSKIKILSGVKLSKKNFLYVFNSFFTEGLIEPTYFNSIRVLFVEESGIPEITIDDFDNIISFYIEYCGGELFYCKSCGSENKKEGNRRPNYCNDCRIKIRREKVRTNVKNHRNSKK